MIDETASLGVDEDVVRRQEVCTKKRMRDVRHEEDPVKVPPQAKGDCQHALAVGPDAAVVGCLQIQASRSVGAVGGRGRQDTVFGPSVDEEVDLCVVVPNLEEATAWLDVSCQWGRRGRLVHLPYCSFPDWDDQEQGDWQERALLPNLRWYQQSVVSGVGGVGVAERSRVRRGLAEREVDLDLSRRDVASTREATVDVSTVMPEMSCFIIAGRSVGADTA